MITATFNAMTVEEGAFYRDYSVEGHANFAPVGQDIVCAAVSCIYTGITNKLLMDFEAVAQTKNGTSKIINTVRCQETSLLISVLEESLTKIAEEYPDYLEVIVNNAVNLKL